VIDTATLSLPLTAELEYGGAHYVPQHDAIAAIGAIQPGELEPYRALLADYLGRHERNHSAGTVIDNPWTYNYTIPRFFRWLAATHPDELTVPQGNTEGDPMPLTTEEIAALEASTDGDTGATAGLAGRLEPYRTLLTEWWIARTGDDPIRVDRIIASPHLWYATLPRFFRWMRDNHKAHPGEQASTVPAPGGSTFHLGDRVRLHLFDGNHEATVTTSGAHRPDPMPCPVVWTDVHADPTWLTADQVTLVSCPHVAPMPETETVPQGNDEVSSEWGPSHPEWTAWWAKARELAERFGYTGQYDTLAEQLGGPSRISYDTVTVTITFPIETDQPVTGAAVRTALGEHGFVLTDRHPR
jgi:hypothetical protein